MVRDNEPISDSIASESEFHLIDLVPRDCCERIDLETSLRRLEQSLNAWLLEKIAAIESEQLTRAPRSVGAATVGGILFEEVSVMSTDDRDILEVLRAELDFIEKGGYGRSVRRPWQPKSVFHDSLTCLNYGYIEKTHPCSECHLIDFMPEDKRAEQVPCHFIPLNESGVTVDELEAENGQWKLERALKSWLRTKIREIEAKRIALQPAG